MRLVAGPGPTLVVRLYDDHGYLVALQSIYRFGVLFEKAR